jgi:NAD(P)-dependent dehydrogenase (short-subunit alcohol dehydrogenase family)
MSGSVLVTGAAGGLGRAVSRRLVADGWRVVAPERGEPAAAEAGVLAVQADVTDETAVAGAIAVAADPDRPHARWSTWLAASRPAAGCWTPVAEFEASCGQPPPDVRGDRGRLPHLIANGGGSVVCVGARAALHPFPGAASYITAKAALLTLVDALAVSTGMTWYGSTPCCRAS